MTEVERGHPIVRSRDGGTVLLAPHVNALTLQGGAVVVMIALLCTDRLLHDATPGRRPPAEVTFEL
ncbi:MAG: hypothetical protein DLM56_03155 [Pseudonocardiales bacterium]|nr:MAG: hypothetical protein DLM56_03155 [Pseudonocardiales bacterium]